MRYRRPLVLLPPWPQAPNLDQKTNLLALVPPPLESPDLPWVVLLHRLPQADHEQPFAVEPLQIIRSRCEMPGPVPPVLLALGARREQC